MRVLVTEAASTLAYHVTSMMAAENIFTGQPIELVLCDHEERRDAVTGLMLELQDCVYPNLKDVSMSMDLLESFQSADVVLILPKLKTDTSGDQQQLHISYALLNQIDFQGLDGAFHQKGFAMQEKINMSVSGPLSSAINIIRCLQNKFLSDLKEISQPSPVSIIAHYHEEAEFGVPPEVDGWSLTSYSTNSNPSYENKLMMFVVSAESSKQTRDKYNNNENDILSFVSRL